MIKTSTMSSSISSRSSQMMIFFFNNNQSRTFTDSIRELIRDLVHQTINRLTYTFDESTVNALKKAIVDRLLNMNQNYVIVLAEKIVRHAVQNINNSLLLF